MGETLMGHLGLSKNDYSGIWPDYLQAAAARASLQNATEAITVIDMQSPEGEQRLAEFLPTATIAKVIDNYDEQLAELFISEHAQLYRASPEIKQNSIAEMLEEHYQETPAWKKGSWVYYPWNGHLIHVLEASLFTKLRTVRNRDLITTQQQEKYAAIRAACFGMSVGSSAAVALILQGGSTQLKIADGAVISGSNLNRIRTGIATVGEEKATVIGRQLYEMNPYIRLEQLHVPVSPNTLGSFLDTSWSTDVVIDEIDDLEVKIRLRVAARERKIPVIMATDLGDDVMLDVERYDLDPNLPLFHGLVGNIEEMLGRKNMTQREWLKYATAIIGTKNVPLDMQKSLLKVGSTLPTQPQLGGTAMVAGAVVAFAVRQLALGEPLKSGRNIVSLESILVTGRSGISHKLRHRKHSKILDGAMKKM
jgi:hypothetical protein